MRLDDVTLDLLEGEKRKREGQARVFDPGWQKIATDAFRSYAIQCRMTFNGRVQARETTMEMFRTWWRGQEDYTRPHHHNCWGALTTNLAKQGLIRPSGRRVNAKSPKTHAHPVLVWEIA